MEATLSRMEKEKPDMQVSNFETIEAKPLSPGTSAQLAEHIPLTQVLELGKGKRVVFYTDGSEVKASASIMGDLGLIPGSANEGVSGLDCEASACNAGALGSIPGSGRSPGEGNGNPLQNSCLENPMDGGA